MGATELTQIVSVIPHEKIMSANYSKLAKENREMRNLLLVAKKALELRQATDTLSDQVKRPQAWPNQESHPGFTNTSKDKPSPQSQYPDRQSCVQANVNAGFSLAAANANCNRYFPPGPATQGGVERSTAGGGKGGQSSKITTYYPRAGTNGGFKQNPQVLETLQTVTHTKQASVLPPAWAVLHGGVFAGEELSTNSLRSASVSTKEEIDDITNGGLAAYALSRVQNNRIQQRRLKQASAEEQQQPAWLTIYNNRFS